VAAFRIAEAAKGDASDQTGDREAQALAWLDEIDARLAANEAETSP